MANAKKCDRCGTYYDMGDFGVTKSGSSTTGISFNNVNLHAFAHIDLCKRCIDKIELFLDGAEVESIDRKDYLND